MLSGSLPFIPIVEKQVFSPVEENGVFSVETCVVNSSSSEEEAHSGFFFGECNNRWGIRECSAFEVYVCPDCEIMRSLGFC